MRRRVTVVTFYCDKCDRSPWSYSGANDDVCDDKAKRDGWQIVTGEVAGVPVQRNLCPRCAA